MSSVRFGAATVIAFILFGCAAAPENIAPANISTVQYNYLNCPQLAYFKRTLMAAYNDAADSENDARNEDSAFFLLAPVGSMTHESVPSQIADLKGRIVAVQTLQTQHNCNRAATGQSR